MTVEAPPQIDNNALADLIEKGKREYTNVRHGTGQLLLFEGSLNPTQACALGYAVLGAYNGDVNVETVDDYYGKLEASIENDEYFDAVVSWNDNEHLPVDEIVTRLREWSDEESDEDYYG